MTIQTLYTAATGMKAMETKLDVIANNMANVNTTAFKKDRANFEDLLYRQYRLPGRRMRTAIGRRPGIEVGLGRAYRQHADRLRPGRRFKRRTIHSTWRSKGTASSMCKDPNGDFLYTRAGTSVLTRTDQIVLGLGIQRLRSGSADHDTARGNGRRDHDRRTGAIQHAESAPR